MKRIVTVFGQLAISTDSGSFSGQDCTVDPWSRDQWEEVSIWGHVLGSVGLTPHPWPAPLFPSHQQSWPIQSCQPSRAREGNSPSSPASAQRAMQPLLPAAIRAC